MYLRLSNLYLIQRIKAIVLSGCEIGVILTILLTCSYFEKFTLLNKPVKNKLGDGKKLFATKLGNVKTSLKVHDRFISIDVQNVLFVKRMGSNLLNLEM